MEVTEGKLPLLSLLLSLKLLQINMQDCLIAADDLHLPAVHLRAVAPTEGAGHSLQDGPPSPLLEVRLPPRLQDTKQVTLHSSLFRNSKLNSKLIVMFTV